MLRRHFYIENYIYGRNAAVVSAAVICIGQSFRLKHVVALPSKAQIVIFAGEHWRYGRWVLATVPFYILSFQGYYLYGQALFCRLNKLVT